MNIAPPHSLLRAIGAAWVQLAGGQIVETPLGSSGTLLHVWSTPGGPSTAMPNRMYGVSGHGSGPLELSVGLRNTTVHLPPGVRVDGDEAHCVTHRLHAEHPDGAWAALKRVGRQGVRRAQGRELKFGPMDAAIWHGLAQQKALAHGAPPLPFALPGALQAAATVEPDTETGILGVWQPSGRPAAAVLWIRSGTYALLIDGSSDRDTWSDAPNNLAVWEATNQLVRAGATLVDFGFSPEGSGDAGFKRHMGGTAERLYRRHF